uniref:Uncharacterized protein n=1 Tax=Mesocestoides corti TaxID=53468 RepID=A0A5K3EJC9_MESCO
MTMSERLVRRLVHTVACRVIQNTHLPSPQEWGCATCIVDALPPSGVSR